MVNVQYTEHFTFEIERATVSQRERALGYGCTEH